MDAAGNPTIAFLARGIEGLVVRITAKGATEGEARALADAEEEELRAILGDLVFGVDDETMEYAVLERLRSRGWSLGVAESVTGGFIGARIVNVPGASDVFRGTIASYATEVKRSVLGVTAENVVSEEAAREMAEGAQRVLGADVGIAVTGVAGPAEQDGVAVGTVCFAIAFPGRPTEAVTTRLPGDRERIRQFATISLAEPGAAAPRRAAAHGVAPAWRSRSTSTATTSTRWSRSTPRRSATSPSGAPATVTGRSWRPTATGRSSCSRRCRNPSSPRTVSTSTSSSATRSMPRSSASSRSVRAGLEDAEFDEYGSRWIVLADPEGNELCLCTT